MMRGVLFLILLLIGNIGISWGGDCNDKFEIIPDPDSRSSEVFNLSKFETVFKEIFLKHLRLPGIREVNKNLLSGNNKSYGYEFIKEYVSEYAIVNVGAREDALTAMIRKMLGEDSGFRKRFEEKVFNRLNAYIEKEEHIPTTEEMALIFNITVANFRKYYGIHGDIADIKNYSGIQGRLEKNFPNLYSSNSVTQRVQAIEKLDQALIEIFKKDYSLERFSYREFKKSLESKFSLPLDDLLSEAIEVGFDTYFLEILRDLEANELDALLSGFYKKYAAFCKSTGELEPVERFFQKYTRDPALANRLVSTNKKSLFQPEDFQHRVISNYSGYFEKVRNKAFFSDEQFAETLELMGQYKKHFYSAVISGAEPHESMNAFLKWTKEIGALPVFIVIEKRTALISPEFLKLARMGKIALLERSVLVNKTVRISNLFVPAKNLRPFSGLFDLGPKKGLTILPHPKLHHVTIPNTRTDDNNMFWSTGAMTGANYFTRNLKSDGKDRTNIISQIKHVHGGLLVEFEGGGIGAIRGVQSANPHVYVRPVIWNPESKGIFDLSRFYPVSGARSKKMKYHGVVLGDTHGNMFNGEFAPGIIKLLDETQPTHIYLHDYFNGTSVNHWRHRSVESLSEDIRNGKINFYGEVGNSHAFMIGLLKRYPKLKIRIILSNHDDWVTRFTTWYKDSPVNHDIGVRLKQIVSDGHHPLEYIARYGFQEKGNLKIAPIPKELLDEGRIVWQKPGQEWKLRTRAGRELVLTHGHKGSSPFKGNPSINLLSRFTQSHVSAHIHGQGVGYISHSDYNIIIGALTQEFGYGINAEYSNVGASVALISEEEFGYTPQILLGYDQEAKEFFANPNDKTPLKLLYPQGYPKVNQELEEVIDYDMEVGGGVDQYWRKKSRN